MINTTLLTVADYVADARTLLQDTVPAYRYDDPSLVAALNVTLLEARRLRADLFVFNKSCEPPMFLTVDSTPVCIEPQFRLGILFGLCAHAFARDQEDFQDARASSFMSFFQSVLLGLRVQPITGGAGYGDGAGTRGGQEGGAG